MTQCVIFATKRSVIVCAGISLPKRGGAPEVGLGRPGSPGFHMEIPLLVSKPGLGRACGRGLWPGGGREGGWPDPLSLDNRNYRTIIPPRQCTGQTGPIALGG